MRAAQRQAFFAILQKRLPAPQTELRYGNTYQLLVAVVLSAQATDVSVNAATRQLFRRVKTPAAMLRLTQEELQQHLHHIGLYRTKARNVLALSQQLLSMHGGKVPATRAALQALPGVGRKTANVVLNTAFGAPEIAVDTHIFRVANRTGLASGRTPRAVEDALHRAVPEQFKQYAHHWLILLGRYTCKARKPQCPTCAVRAQCTYAHKTPAEA